MSDKSKGQVPEGSQEGEPLGVEVEEFVAPSVAGTEITGYTRDFAHLAETTLIGLAPNIDSTEQLDERLQALVVEAIDALPEDKRFVKGKVRTGEEIARAIPDQAAFLHEIDLMQEGTFFELNERGQLVMMDGCAEAYGLGENALQAKIRQTRIVYRGAEGETKTMAGEQYFKVTRQDEKGNPLEMEVSEEAQKIDRQSIIMARGLPTLQWDEANCKYTGEYARMNDQGQFEQYKLTWTEDESLDSSLARDADRNDHDGGVRSAPRNPEYRGEHIGSRGVLRVNLNLEA